MYRDIVFVACLIVIVSNKRSAFLSAAGTIGCLVTGGMWVWDHLPQIAAIAESVTRWVMAS